MKTIRIGSRIVTWAALGAALFCALVWWGSGTDLESAVTALVLLSAVSGLFVERWAVRTQRRRDVLYALRHELRVNQHILSDPIYDRESPLPKGPRALPYLLGGVADHALASGVFSDGGEVDLLLRLHIWRFRVQQFNRRLTITENQMYANPSEAGVRDALETLRYGRTLRRTRRTLTKLLRLLTQRYPREAALDSDFEGHFMEPHIYFPSAELPANRPQPIDLPEQERELERPTAGNEEQDVGVAKHAPDSDRHGAG